MFEIEFEPPEESICACCGNTTISLTRFVLRDGSAYAVYYAQFTKWHADNAVNALIGLGEWGEHATPDDRNAFPFNIWLKDGSPVISLVEAADSPWSQSRFLGPLLGREEALCHPWIRDVFDLTDLLILEDREIRSHFLLDAHRA